MDLNAELFVIILNKHINIIKNLLLTTEDRILINHYRLDKNYYFNYYFVIKPFTVGNSVTVRVHMCVTHK